MGEQLDIRNKIVVITGGGSGISLAFARLCVSAGSKVLIADLRLTTEAELFVSQHSKIVEFVKCDVSIWREMEVLGQRAIAAWGDVPDVWVAGAGVFEPAWSNFWDDPERERYAEVDINIGGTIKFVRIAIRTLLGQNKKGTVLTIASIAGLYPSLGAALYCATKHAIVGFVRSVAEAEEMFGVRVMTICPGLVKTPLWTDHPDLVMQFGYSDEAALLPAQVAEAMFEMVIEEKYKGGTVLEVGIRGNKLIPSPGSATEADGGPESAVAERTMYMQEVIKAKLRHEIGASLLK